MANYNIPGQISMIDMLNSLAEIGAEKLPSQGGISKNGNKYIHIVDVNLNQYATLQQAYTEIVSQIYDDEKFMKEENELVSRWFFEKGFSSEDRQYAISLGLEDSISGWEQELVEEKEYETHIKASQDFGEHIGGARKELWKSRGLMYNDLDEMNDAERLKYVKRDNVWKKPDYEKMIKSGIPKEVVYAIKKIRDSITTTPNIGYFDKSEEQKLTRQQEYIEFVSAFRDRTMSMTCLNDLRNLANDFLYKEKYIVKNGSMYRAEVGEKCHGLMSNKLYRACQINDSTLMQYKREIAKLQFGVSKDEKLPTGFFIKLYDGNGYSKHENWLKDTYYITKGYSIIQTNIESYKEAFDRVKEIASMTRAGGKKAFVPKQLAHVERKGLPDVCKGKNIDGNDYINKLHIRAGEFGNWMSEKDAQASLNMGFEAFYDFANALGIKPEQASFNGRLAIAFGARGQGKAVAHYEPMREVINLTKMKGAGSLGHELFHALDDIIGKELGFNGMMSEHSNREIPLSMKKVMEKIKYRPATEQEKIDSYNKRLHSAEERLIQWVDSKLPDSKLTEEQIKKKIEIIRKMKESKEESYTPGEDSYIDKLSELKKEATGHIIRKDDRTDIYWALRSYRDAVKSDLSNMRIPSDYYKMSKKMDNIHSKDSFGYWTSSCEMFARAGACFLSDSLKNMGGKSDYLSGHSESCISFEFDKNGEIQVIKAMPEGNEREAINTSIKDLIYDLNERGLFLSKEERENISRDEAIVKLENGMYLHLQYSDSQNEVDGMDSVIDYTVYDTDGKEIDGGQMEYLYENNPSKDVITFIPDVIHFHFEGIEKNQGFMFEKTKDDMVQKLKKSKKQSIEILDR